MEEDLSKLEVDEIPSKPVRQVKNVSYVSKKKKNLKKPLTEKNFVWSKPESLRYQKFVEVNTTSKSFEEWSKGLSPFFLGPVKLYGEFVSQNVENAWQYCKVYHEHLDEKGNPGEEYFKWAKEGWNNPKPVRFPMGRGAKPAYSYWNGEKLGYVDARIKIYSPLYAQIVEKSEAFQKLQEIYKNANLLVKLWDFDGYDHWKFGMSLEDCMFDEKKEDGPFFCTSYVATG